MADTTARIALEALAYVRYRVPDLDALERFLVDFGLTRAARTADALYMRGTGPEHHLYIAEQGATAFGGLAFTVADTETLARAAILPDAGPVEAIDAPGGGQRVRLTSPHGYAIELVHGIESTPARDVRESFELNTLGARPRINRAIRQPREPALVQRIGHAVLWAADAAREVAWFMDRFDLTPSDYICIPAEPDPVPIGTFLRFDRGEELVEHHVLLITQSAKTGCHHSSFEVADLDAVNAGHEYLQARGWTLDAGVGRHLLGSLIYDYWLDPFGNRVEHYTDPDIVNDRHRPTRFTGTIDETTQWGMAPPPAFFE
jgi:catechol 2,3-dioxygenase-like lactoylglutathione lyase family enzyme